MTDKPTPTTDLLKRCAEIHEWRSTGVLSGEALRDYAKRKWPDHHDTLQMAEHETTVTEALALLAKWRQTAVKGEPVAWLSPWRKDQVTTDYDAYGKQGIPLYAAPQPVAREPLTDEQIKALMQAHRTAMLMTCKARAPECGEFAAIAQDLDWLCESFGIKGGQHGTE